MAVCERSAWVLALLCWDVLCHQEHGSCTGTVGVQLGVRVVEVITSPGYQQMKKMSCCPQSAQPPLLAASVVEDEVRGRAYSQLADACRKFSPHRQSGRGSQGPETSAGRVAAPIPLPPPACSGAHSPHELSPQPRAPAAPVSHRELTQAALLYLSSGHKLPAGGRTEPAEVHCPLGAVCATSQQPALTEG